jgi:phospholipid/cholesterol/gamma-HCH transport system substrate-binding protein
LKADHRTKSRVGIIVFTSLLLFAVAIVVVGGKTGFFLARVSYHTYFPNSQGLIEGNQVRLAGVTVGAVRDVRVPRKPGQDLFIAFDIEKRYAHLIKNDSKVEIKTIGLLGDKYLELTMGSPNAPDLPPGSEIAAYRGAELDKLIAGSGDLMENVIAISKSARAILGRTEEGKGFLGELTSESASGKELSASLRKTLETTNHLLDDVREGRGLLGRMIHDEALANSITSELEGSLQSVRKVLGGIEKGVGDGEGALPALLGDPEGKKKVYALIDSLKFAADGLGAFSKSLNENDGVLPKLLRDEEFAKEFLGDLKKISSRLANVAEKLDGTDGTVGKLISDPAVYEAVNDILVGFNESKMLRWLVRNRQKSGIQVRYDEEQAKAAATPAADRPAIPLAIPVAIPVVTPAATPAETPVTKEP